MRGSWTLRIVLICAVCSVQPLVFAHFRSSGHPSCLYCVRNINMTVSCAWVNAKLKYTLSSGTPPKKTAMSWGINWLKSKQALSIVIKRLLFMSWRLTSQSLRICLCGSEHINKFGFGSIEKCQINTPKKNKGTFQILILICFSQWIFSLHLPFSWPEYIDSRRYICNFKCDRRFLMKPLALSWYDKSLVYTIGGIHVLCTAAQTPSGRVVHIYSLRTN